MPPAYQPDPGPRALARRLGALATAGVPVRCGVWLGLAEPGPGSSRLAEVTHAVARHFADGDVAALPRFNTNPSPVTRVFAAASHGRVDALGPDMAAFPDDLASPLWWRVLSRARAELSTAERSVAADVLLRLGYQRHAADVLGMADFRGFTPGLAVRQLAVLFWSRPSSREVEELALHGARDPGLPADARHALALFVLVRNGRRGTDTAALREAAALAGRTAPDDPLARQAHYRALAFVPFLRGDRTATWDLLDRALDSQRAARPGTPLDRLARDDYAYPLHETIARTHLRTGAPDKAVDATGVLVALSPNDARTWSIRGDALLAADRLEEAVRAFDAGVALGGLPAARAAFYRGWALDRLGRRADAVESYRLSWRIDPTVPAVARASGVGPGEVA
ncbi:tetratricopeptide (TPR) repeat protein [Saccharothrix tamanrassetensis]|uniref:Tetratricopeptide (TPR) repeat protein n=1 Tax=Saccharothrix tamanrassetensis TaxID=1051531 RepID=A0A841C645_9PSEU|nr:tetratricopeptide repeat protein [Saccharothrix tamanrassetensis]MBB5954012.1 tetratricopeptide (TPR) repeat protein [Saccharothrix tamanrassetensis]